MLRAIRDLGEASVAVTAPSTPVAAEPTRRDDAERRQLTVMFCDLVSYVADFVVDNFLTSRDRDD
jgi:hypothetical protein